MSSANSIAFCQTSNFSKLNIFFFLFCLSSLNSQLETLNFTYSFFALNGRFRNEAVRDAISGMRAAHYLGIPTRTPRRVFRRRAALLLPGFDVLCENVPRKIRSARARRCTSARQTRENQPLVQRARGID